MSTPPNNIPMQSLTNALGTFVYIGLVAWFMNHIEQFFGGSPEPDTWLAPLFLILLFVISAGVTGSLVVGRPVMLYIAGERREAVRMLVATLVWLLVGLVIVGVVISLSR